MGFEWDLTQHKGFMFSEALQGYAPLTSGVRVAKVTIGPVLDSGKAVQIDGHPCQSKKVTVITDEGVNHDFQIWSASDLKGLPLEITSTTPTNAFTIRLSQVRVEVPASELFLPPDGFTKYDSPDALASELMVRSQGRHRSSGGEEGSSDRPESRQGRRHGP